MDDLETINGIASAITTSSEGGKTVWRFRLETGDGVLIPVEIRGDEIRGSLDDGDEVEVLTRVKDKSTEGVQSKHIRNLTTSFEIKAYERSRIRRGSSFTQVNFTVGILAALGGAVVSALFSALKSATTTVATTGPGPPGSVIISYKTISVIPLWAYYAGAALPIVVVAGLVLLDTWKNARPGPGGFHRNLRRRHWVPIVAGVVAGDLLTVLITALFVLMRAIPRWTASTSMIQGAVGTGY